jgi:hypothetical protein
MLDQRQPRKAAPFPSIAAAAGYDLQEELDFLSNRAMEPNVFFSSRFLAPAMPRLEDREIRLAVIRDENGQSRLRLLMPFSVEKPGFSIGTPIIRAWANSFGPLGTPLVDAENAAETIDHFFDALGREEANCRRFWFCRMSASMAPSPG